MSCRPGHPHPEVRVRVLASALVGVALAACSNVERPASGRAAGARDSVSFATFQDLNPKAENLAARGQQRLHVPLTPGFRYVLEDAADPQNKGQVEVMVLEQTEPFDLPGFGRFECAVVQTDELQNGVLERQVHEWLAIDNKTQAIYTFGAVSWDVDAAGEKVFAGMWRAGEGQDGHIAEPALVVPGKPVRGERYRSAARGTGAGAYSEVMETGVELKTSAGKFSGCVRTREIALSDPHSFTDRWWCPGVGLVRDQADGELVASDALKSDLSAFGHHAQEAAAPQAQDLTHRITPEQAQAIALKEVPGTFRDVAIERRGSLLVYVVEIIATADGVETDVFVDVSTGKVVASEK